MRSWKNITLLDLNILVAMSEQGSVRGVARTLKLNPSHVSKILKSLEEKLERSLFKTSPKGITLTRDANDIVQYAKNILQNSNQFVGNTDDSAHLPHMEILTIGALSFLNKALVSHALKAMNDDYRFRLLDLSPDQLPLAAFKGIIELAVHTNPENWTKAWDVTKLGSVRWALIARKDHPVLSRLTSTEVIRYPFVVPTYWEDSRYVSGDDFFPIPWSKRIKGHEASTADTALQLVLSTDHLAFLPALLLRAQHAEAELDEIKLPGLPVVRKDVFLLTRIDRIRKKTQQRILRGLTSVLNRVESLQ